MEVCVSGAWDLLLPSPFACESIAVVKCICWKLWKPCNIWMKNCSVQLQWQNKHFKEWSNKPGWLLNLWIHVLLLFYKPFCWLMVCVSLCIHMCACTCANVFGSMCSLQICHIVTAITVCVRLDVFAVFYTVLMIVVMVLRRHTAGRIWWIYMAILAILLPLQYLMALGFPPAACICKYNQRTITSVPGYNGEPTWGTSVCAFLITQITNPKDYYYLMNTNSDCNILLRSAQMVACRVCMNM